MTAAGYPADYLELTYTCPLCKDTGFVNGVRCRCLKEEMQRLSVAELNASSPLTKSRFEDFDLSFYPDTVDPATGQNPRLFMEKETERIWMQEKRTVVFVTNSIDEALTLGDRIYTMKNKLPGTLCNTYKVDLARPREPTDRAFLRLRQQIIDESELVL